MAVLHITKDNFEAEVMNSDKPVLIDFWASWCGPCQMLSPIVDEISNEVTNAKICKVNVDEERGLAEKFGVMNIPALFVVNDGKVVNQAVGVRPKEQILELLNV